MGRTRWGWLQDRYHRASRHQALVVDWRRTPAGWEAQLVRVDEVADRVVVEWVPADRLTPVESALPIRRRKVRVLESWER